jgi:phosphate transport system protein
VGCSAASAAYPSQVAPPALPLMLDELSDLLARMCSEAAASMRGATTGLLEGRLRLAEKIASEDATMKILQARIEDVATDALLFHAPVAGDLRRVVAAIRTSGDLERMSVLARHVAESAVRRGAPCAVPDRVRPAFAEMGRVAVALAHKAAEVVRTGNVIMAIELSRSWPYGIPAAVDVTLLARYYERFADHAVMVASETATAVTGRRPHDLMDLLGETG